MCDLGRGDGENGGAAIDDAISSSSSSAVLFAVVVVIVRVVSPATSSPPAPTHLSTSRVTYLSWAGLRKGTGAKPVSSPPGMVGQAYRGRFGRWGVKKGGGGGGKDIGVEV